jgi:hypothetical protein
MNPKELKAQFEAVCGKLIKAFCKKQNVDFEYWIGDIVGGTAYFSDFYFNLDEIVHDITTEQPKGLILKWHNQKCEHDQYINYYSYTMGLRWDMLP